MQTFRLRLNGPNAGEVGRILAGRLAEFECRAELDGSPGAMECAIKITTPSTSRLDDDLAVELDAHDTADFAAEKVIDILAENGVVSLRAADYTPEEEEQIRRRLHDLGYIE